MIVDHAVHSIGGVECLGSVDEIGYSVRTSAVRTRFGLVVLMMSGTLCAFQ